jgi:hypothetical protein
LFGHTLRRVCLLKHIIEGKIEGRIEVTGRWGRRCIKLLNDPNGNTGYCKLYEETIDHTLWRTRFWRGCGRMNAFGIHTWPNFRCSPSIFLKNLRKTTIDFSQVVIVRQRFEPHTSLYKWKLLALEKSWLVIAELGRTQINVFDTRPENKTPIS